MCIIISIHEALASLDELDKLEQNLLRISIHEALASLDLRQCTGASNGRISIHEALASLDDAAGKPEYPGQHFDPRGSCEPRPSALGLPCLQN